MVPVVAVSSAKSLFFAPRLLEIRDPTPTPVPTQDSGTKLNVPLVVTMVVLIAVLAAAVGALSTVIFLKKKYGDFGEPKAKAEEKNTDRDDI